MGSHPHGGRSRGSGFCSTGSHPHGGRGRGERLQMSPQGLACIDELAHIKGVGYEGSERLPSALAVLRMPHVRLRYIGE